MHNAACNSDRAHLLRRMRAVALRVLIVGLLSVRRLLRAVAVALLRRRLLIVGAVAAVIIVATHASNQRIVGYAEGGRGVERRKL